MEIINRLGIVRRVKCQATVLDFKSCDPEVLGFEHAQHARESAS